MPAHQAAFYGRRWYIHADCLPYQIAFGISLRWLEGAHVRLYLGPIKFAAGYMSAAKKSLGGEA